MWRGKRAIIIYPFYCASILYQGRGTLVFHQIPVGRFRPTTLYRRFFLQLLLLPTTFRRLFRINVNERLLQTRDTTLPPTINVRTRHANVTHRGNYGILLRTIMIMLRNLMLPVPRTRRRQRLATRFGRRVLVVIQILSRGDRVPIFRMIRIQLLVHIRNRVLTTRHHGRILLRNANVQSLVVVSVYIRK